MKAVVKAGGQNLVLRDRVIRPRTGRRETFLVAGLITLIIGPAGLRVGMLAEPDPGRQLRPYQQLDNVLTAAPRTLYRTLLSGLPEILMLREQEGLWPEAELLAMAAIPPFAPQFLPPALQGYVWVGYDGGSWIDYLGQDPGNEDSPSFIFRLIDLHGGYHPHPHPGIDYDPERAVASQIWFFPASRAYPGERLPEAGWSWLLSPNDPLLELQQELDPLTAQVTPGSL